MLNSNEKYYYCIDDQFANMLTGFFTD